MATLKQDADTLLEQAQEQYRQALAGVRRRTDELRKLAAEIKRETERLKASRN